MQHTLSHSLAGLRIRTSMCMLSPGVEHVLSLQRIAAAGSDALQDGDAVMVQLVSEAVPTLCPDPFRAAAGPGAL